MIGGPGKDRLWGSSWWRRGIFWWPHLSMIVFASRRFGWSHSFPVAWKWKRRRLEAVFIYQTLSLSLKNLNENLLQNQKKSSKLELTFCWKLIGVSDERWSRGARTRFGVRIFVESSVRIWAWKGISILGVLTIWGFWRFGGFEVSIWQFGRKLKFYENSNLLGFLFKLLFTIWGFSFSEIFGRAPND